MSIKCMQTFIGAIFENGIIARSHGEAPAEAREKKAHAGFYIVPEERLTQVNLRFLVLLAKPDNPCKDSDLRRVLIGFLGRSTRSDQTIPGSPT